MLIRIIFYLGAAITALTFVLTVQDLTAAGTRNVIRNSFTNIRSFFLLIGIPYLILSLLLLNLLLLPNYLFPIQLVLLLMYGIGRKYLIGSIQRALDQQPSIQSDGKILASDSPPRPDHISGCGIRFIILLASLALAICGALWVLANEENQWILYPAVGVIALFLLFARLSEFAHLIRLFSRHSSKKDDE